MPDSAHVVIVGAGPAGAALAHILSTRGVRVTLIERQRDFAREFRGEALAPGGVAVLEQLGIDAALARVPTSFPTAIELYNRRRKVFRAPFDAVASARAPRVISQPHLLEAIVAETEGSPGFRFVRGGTVRELLRTDRGGRISGVRVQLEDGEEKIDCDLVVGCDGRASVVRRDAELPVETEDLPMDIVWCKMARPDLLGDDRPLRACIGGGHLFICYVAPDGLLQLAWVIFKGTFGALRKAGPEEWVEEMVQYAPHDLTDHLRAHTNQLHHPFLLATVADRVTRWTAPGALVIGDAAHTMSPVGGQGLNIALRDALVAANELVPVLRGGTDPARIDAATARVEAARVDEVVEIQRLQALPPRVILQRTWWGELLRTVPELLRFSFVRAGALRLATPFLFGTSDLTLEV